jgi:hypothetical protein
VETPFGHGKEITWYWKRAPLGHVGHANGVTWKWKRVSLGHAQGATWALIGMSRMVREHDSPTTAIRNEAVDCAAAVVYVIDDLHRCQVVESRI